MKSFAELSPLSRVWIYQADRNLTEQEVSEIQLLSAAFVSNWTAHGSLLNASADVFYNRFIILVADENQVLASGCSIDKSIGFIKDLEKHFNLNLLDRLNVAYFNGDTLNTFKFHELDEMIDSGIIKNDTVIFNNQVKNLGELKSQWRIKLIDSQLGRYLTRV